MTVAAISVTAGNNGSTTVGQLYPQNVVLFARQADFSPVAGVLLQATLPTNPGGTFSTFGAPRVAIVTTDSTGHATLPSILADGAVGNWTGAVIVAGVPSISTTFSMAAVSGVTLVPTALTLQSSGATGAITGQAFGAQVFKVVDQFASPMPGKTVTFTVPSAGNGTFVGGVVTTTAVTDSNGLATMPTLVAGATVATFNMTASILALNVAVPLTVANGATAASISVISGANQYTPPSTGFAHPMVALVRNTLGTPLGGVAVTITKPGAGASCTCASNALTNASGLVSIDAIANATSGTYEVSMAVAGVTLPAVFTMTNQVSGNVCTTAARPTGFGTTPYLGGQGWTDVEQILFNADGAQCALVSGQSSNIIRGSTFGITIPEDCTITGYKVTYKAASSVAGATITPYLFTTGGFLTGTALAQALSTVMTAYQRGAANDTWGNVYTPAQVSGSGFSVGFIANSPVGAKTVSLANVMVSVCYNTPQGVVISTTMPAGLLSDF